MEIALALTKLHTILPYYVIIWSTADYVMKVNNWVSTINGQKETPQKITWLWSQAAQMAAIDGHIMK